MARMEEIIKGFQSKRIIVVGDLMVDRYDIGDATRLSPEAPIAIHKHKYTKDVPGGAGNTARNLALLGATVYVAGVIGVDTDGNVLLNLMDDLKMNRQGVLREYNGRVTTVKTRFLAENYKYQEMFRSDKENTSEISGVAKEALITEIEKIIPQIDVIVVSEYAKGCFTREIADVVRREGHNKIIVADIKPPHKDYVKGYTVLKPNEKEAREMAGTPDMSPKNLANDIGQKLDISVVITVGEEGSMAYYKNTGETRHIATKGRESFDVTGAGDTSAAVLALSLLSGADLFEAASIANAAAGIVVQKRKKWEQIISLKELLEAV